MTYGDTSLGNGSGGVILGGEDVAGGPGNLSTESGQGLDQDGGLDGHVERTGNASTSEDLLGTIILAESDETGHLVLGKLDLLATEGSEADVSCKWQTRNRSVVGSGRRDWVILEEERDEGFFYVPTLKTM